MHVQRGQPELPRLRVVPGHDDVKSFALFSCLLLCWTFAFFLCGEFCCVDSFPHAVKTDKKIDMPLLMPGPSFDVSKNIDAKVYDRHLKKPYLICLLLLTSCLRQNLPPRCQGRHHRQRSGSPPPRSPTCPGPRFVFLHLTIYRLEWLRSGGSLILGSGVCFLGYRKCGIVQLRKAQGLLQCACAKQLSVPGISFKPRAGISFISFIGIWH